jgi:HAD superfamily hydrolase (TIGR01509 family)
MGLKFEAVLFDCDGVLVDSEAITNGVLRDMLAERGWVMTLEECLHQFLGKAVIDQGPLIAERTGQPVTAEWMAQFRERRNLMLTRHVKPIAQIQQALQAVQAQWGDCIACASGADRPKIELQLRLTGLAPFFAGRVFSGQEQASNKPAPDVYLAAARALGADPRRCAVVEDSVTGVTAGAASGATVFGYAPAGDGAGLRSAGAAQVFGAMSELPGLLLGAARHQ